MANQGLIQSSTSPTDAAISGAGFFVVNTQPGGGGEQLYTRAGSFNPDFQGDLRTPSGHYLQGWVLDADEEIVDVNTLETVNVRSINGLAAATTTVDVGANLDADQAAFAGAYAAGDLTAFRASGGATGVQPSFTREDVQRVRQPWAPARPDAGLPAHGRREQLGRRGERRAGRRRHRRPPERVARDRHRHLRRRRIAANRRPDAARLRDRRHARGGPVGRRRRRRRRA